MSVVVPQSVYVTRAVTFVPHDDVFCVFEGVVHEVVAEENASDFGKHIVVEHVWPAVGGKFFTLYAHLSEISAGGLVMRGQKIGKMGQTSRSADARNWMSIAPHLHFEVKDAHGRPYNP